MRNDLQCPALPSQQIKKDRSCSKFHRCGLPAKVICEAVKPTGEIKRGKRKRAIQ